MFGGDLRRGGGRVTEEGGVPGIINIGASRFRAGGEGAAGPGAIASLPWQEGTEEAGGGGAATRDRQHEDDSTRSPAAVKPTGVMHRPPPGALAHVGFGLWWPHAGAIHDVLTWKHHV